MMKKVDRKLILENGTELYGSSFGAVKDVVLELVFNTSMAGYQEILSDPSYTGRAIVLTYPVIGNYGMSNEDYESQRPTAGALIVRDYNDEPSSFRSDESLGSVMKRYGIPGISQTDTRKLTRIIREYGSCRVFLTSADTKKDEGLEMIHRTGLSHDTVARVSTKKKYLFGSEELKYHVAAIDCGMKLNILRTFNRHGCRVTVLPYDTTAEEIKKLSPDGIFISNGPGDPADVGPVIETIKKLKGSLPMFGICLGHQLIGLACGAETYKLKFGHRGGNHPVMDMETGRIEITSQNHSYAVDAKSITKTGLEITHVNLLDDTVEGMCCKKDRVFSVQYHPESAPGPCDSEYLFDRFTGLMEESSFIQRKDAESV